jgi:hypothetical protein
MLLQRRREAYGLRRMPPREEGSEVLVCWSEGCGQLVYFGEERWKEMVIRMGIGIEDGISLEQTLTC